MQELMSIMSNCNYGQVGNRNYIQNVSVFVSCLRYMLKDINPKLPMRDKNVTKEYYSNQLGFTVFGSAELDDYLMMERDQLQIHFFKFKALDPKENYGQVYIRTDDIDVLYDSLLQNKTEIHPNGTLENKPWGQKEFSVLDPDNNLLTFGQSI